VSGTMRNIVSQLTVEELNGNREESAAGRSGRRSC
jgi:hypothetical protein